MTKNTYIRQRMGDITEKIFSGGTPNTRRPEYWNGDLMWLSSGETCQPYITRTKRAITQEGVKNSSTRLAKKNDVVIASAGQGNTRGQTSYLKEDMYINQSVISLRANSNLLDSLYLYYNISSRYKELRALSEGNSIRGSLTTKIIGDLEISLPPLPEQKRISSILSSFDNKIEQLKKENNILEDIAQNIFKEWFVKYNFPNKDGKPYKDNNGKMIDSELGEIPEGWRVGKLEDLVEIKNGFAFKSEDYRDSGYPIIRTMNFEDTGYINNQSLVYISEQEAEGYKNFNLNEFDLCVVMVGASLGKTALVTRSNLPALQNQNMWSFKPKKEEIRFYNNLFLQELVKQNLRSASGSAREFFRKDYFYNVDVIIPSDTTILNFDRKVKPIFQNLSNNLQMINTLSNIKKSLLSILIVL